MAFTKIVGAGIQTTTDVTIRNVQAGVVTATKFIGDISEATGAAAGLGTALSQTLSSPLNKLYYTDKILSIGSTITVDPPSTSNVAYTQYSEIAVEEGADLIIEDGDDLVPDVLGLSTGTAAPLSGAGGRVRADQFTNKTGTGAPTFPNGVQVTGVVTATSFSGNLTGNINATGVSTLGNTVIGGGTTQVVINGDLRVTGIITSGTSSITIDGTRNIVSTGNTVSVGATSITVGSTFIRPTSVGLGATTTTGRNSGVGTAAGTLIYNSSTATVQFYDGSGWYDTSRTFTEATGGTISDYTSGSTVYRAHIFTASGTFNVTNAGPGSVEYLVVAGGGGGGGGYGGGGGAGGFLTGTGFSVTASPGVYSITVGAGGNGGISSPPYVAGSNGTPSWFGIVGVSTITSQGGGGGAISQTAGGSALGAAAGNGGSGGGGSTWTNSINTVSPQAAGTGNRETGTSTPAPSQGNPGGNGGPPSTSTASCGGGGGAGGAGSAGPSVGVGGAGGSGTTSSITGISSTYAGGGGGAGTSTLGSGGPGGGGNGGSPTTGATSATYSTGGGGGGGSGAVPAYLGGNGGSGIVVVRYPIGNIAATAKATGGLISYTPTTTVHTFLSSGTFTVTNPSLTSVNYLVVAGGGGGGSGTDNAGGGGGAGGFRTGTGLPVSVSPGVYPVTVGAGGNKDANGSDSVFNSPGVESSTKFTSTGGGRGADRINNAAGTGGSGGGGAEAANMTGSAGNTPPFTPSQGNTGGNGSNNVGGGGGGAGGPGSAGTPNGSGGAGGNGTASTISGTSITYAGGGGGGTNHPGTPQTRASGGPGGGGAGGLQTPSTPAVAGTENTGGGGGGRASGAPGAAGGSGIVIIAYPS